MSHPLSPCRLPSKRFSWHWVSECERMPFLLQILLKKEMTVIAQYFECILLLNMFFFNLYLKCMVLTYNVSPEPSVNCHFLEIFTHVKTAKLPVYCLAWYQFKWLHIPLVDPGEGPRGPTPPPRPLFLDQTEAHGAEKVFFETGSSLFSPPPPPPALSEGLDPPLYSPCVSKLVMKI